MKYAPRKVYIKESGGYAELTYTDFCRRRQTDQSYMDKLFIPVQGCLLEVVREQYVEFYKDKERWRYLKNWTRTTACFHWRDLRTAREMCLTSLLMKR